MRAGGRPIEKPVRHVILSWAEADEPSREHMVNTGKDYLEYMGWADHQAIMVAHQDKPYAHLHLIVNAVHPETGRRWMTVTPTRVVKNGRCSMSLIKIGFTARSGSRMSRTGQGACRAIYGWN